MRPGCKESFMELGCLPEGRPFYRHTLEKFVEAEALNAKLKYTATPSIDATESSTIPSTG
jgi:hypothetical protein